MVLDGQNEWIEHWMSKTKDQVRVGDKKADEKKRDREIWTVEEEESGTKTSPEIKKQV